MTNRKNTWQYVYFHLSSFSNADPVTWNQGSEKDESLSVGVEEYFSHEYIYWPHLITENVWHYMGTDENCDPRLV